MRGVLLLGGLAAILFAISAFLSTHLQERERSLYMTGPRSEAANRVAGSAKNTSAQAKKKTTLPIEKAVPTQREQFYRLVLDDLAAERKTIEQLREQLERDYGRLQREITRLEQLKGVRTSAVPNRGSIRTTTYNTNDDQVGRIRALVDQRDLEGAAQLLKSMPAPEAARVLAELGEPATAALLLGRLNQSSEKSGMRP
ncbi:MAG: hypothetical protein KatS3mg105_4262 [Gemmatales bacterium]|nr:MAG: hypothetical protein KatS3mg105_4262 [Gemmatales bacterium]